MLSKRKVQVAVVQAAPVLFDLDASVTKACSLIHDAATKGAELVLFPEAFLPAYPRGLNFGMTIGSREESGRKIWQLYWENAVDLRGPAIEAIQKAAKSCGCFVAMGIIEKDAGKSAGTLYCTTVYISAAGEILGKHRKIKPTALERCIWGEGDGSTLTVVETELGKIGGLICWENYMPLARMVMYDKGIEIYLAPTADARDTWQATMQHIACEGRCFVLGCNQFVTKSMVPANLRMRPEMSEQPEVMCRGGSVIISPMGEILAGPLFDAESILYAECDLTEIIRSKLDFDVTGHYARPDIFQLQVNESPQEPVIRKTS